MAWRQLKALSGKGEVWAQDLLDMMYMEDEAKAWAEAGIADEDDDSVPTVDSNGAVLQEGDSVTLIKDLDVKGAGFTAKRGTLVKGIRLTNNPLHIEGKVNGVQIVLVAAYLKRPKPRAIALLSAARAQAQRKKDGVTPSFIPACRKRPT